VKPSHSFTKLKHQNPILKYLSLFLVLFALNFTACAQQEKPSPHSIIFTNASFADALKQAAAQHKYLFVDAYASWCGPCKLLQSTTFHNKKAAEFYNANFINLSIDMEKGEGPQLAQVWGITAYPTLIVFTPSGKPLLGTMGYMGADDLIKFGKQAMSKGPAN
jgi:thiol:disulfide interchange protein